MVPVAPRAAANITLSSNPVLTYPYSPYNEGKMDPQLTGWPLNVDELDLWADFTNADGTLKTSLYSDGHLHLGPDGYEVLAAKLKSVLITR